MTFNLKRYLAPAVLAAAACTFALPSQAATATYNLTRVGNLTNVDDSAGRWQFDGGRVYMGSTHVGYYVRKKRVSFGIPSSVNKAAVETTIIWKWGNYNFTVQGSHYFGNGLQVGGVSATSAGWTSLQNGTYTGNSNSITVTY